MKAEEKKVDLFEYDDYRTYLKDWYHQSRKNSRAFSFRALAKRGGFKSSNFLVFVMQGKRNLTEKSLNKVIAALGLNKQEEDFFKNLVYFNQSTTHDEKNSYFQRLIQSKKFGQIKPMEKKQYQFYSEWYHPVVRELVVASGFDGTPEWIAGRISPSVTPTQVLRSIELLESLNLIAKNGDHRWKQASPVISTGADLTSVVVQNYHKNVLGLTYKIMDELSMEHRILSSLTLGINRGKMAELEKRIGEFRENILKLASEESEPEEVVLLNLQFYPVTKGVALEQRRNQP